MRILQKQSILPVIFSLSFSGACIATQDDAIDEVTVTALRLDTTLRESGASISIISAEMIKSRGYIYLADAIVSVPGVTMNQSGPFGGQASARIRGASSAQTLVLIDGVAANDMTSPGGGFDFGTADTTDIERIEVLKGPQSTLWGADAIGGVINIVSKRPEQGFAGMVKLEGGSFGSRHLAASVSGANEIGDFRLSLSDIHTDGISKADEDDGNSEEDGFDSQTISLKSSLNLPGKARLAIIFRNTEAETEFDSFGIETGVEDGDVVSETKHTVAQVTLYLPLLHDRLENTLTYGHTEIERDNYNDGAASFSADGERKLLRYQGSFSVSAGQRIAIGYEVEDSKAGSDDTSTDGLFVLYQFQPATNVTVSMGIRREDHDSFGTETVGRIAGAWMLNSDVSLRATWGQGFKAPTIFQSTFFCCSAVAANAALAAELSESFDIGLDWQFADDRAALSVTYFDQDIDNLITFAFAVGAYENIANVESKGIELSVNYDFSDALSLTVNAAYIDSRDGNGQNLGRIPEKTADISLTWRPLQKLTTNLVVVYNDEEEEDGRGTVDDWTRVDLSASYVLNDHFELFGRIENLLDSDYQQIFGYGTPERSGYFGARYRF